MLAGHARILVVVAVVAPPSRMRAIAQLGLATGASNLVEPDRAAALAKECSGACRAAEVAQLKAHNLRVGGAPGVIAHGAPQAITVELDAPLELGRAAAQCDSPALRR